MDRLMYGFFSFSIFGTGALLFAYTLRTMHPDSGEAGTSLFMGAMFFTLLLAYGMVQQISIEWSKSREDY